MPSCPAIRTSSATESACILIAGTLVTPALAGHRGGHHGCPHVSSVAVRQAQRALKNRSADIVVDGVLGPRTHAALRQFQKEKGLAPTGCLDNETIARFNL